MRIDRGFCIMKKTETMIAFLGKGTEYEGKLTFNGTVRIDGHFKGEISAAGTIIVGEGATVEADIHISHIVISGEVHGNIIADHRITISPIGKAFGKIQAPTVVIDEGGIFEGNCLMHKKQEPEGRKRAVMEAGEYPGDFAAPLGTIQGIVTGYPRQSPDRLYDTAYAEEEEKTIEPIKDARVSASCMGFAVKSTRTDDFGFYELTDLKDGKWRLKVEANGYEAIKATVEVSCGGTYTQNFEHTSRDKTPDLIDESEGA
jgi:cytoskeletal protein CcmA (bactofilin family)